MNPHLDRANRLQTILACYHRLAKTCRADIPSAAIQTLEGAEAAVGAQQAEGKVLMKRTTNSGRREDPRSRGCYSHEMRERTSLHGRRKRRLLPDRAADTFSIALCWDNQWLGRASVIELMR